MDETEKRLEELAESLRRLNSSLEGTESSFGRLSRGFSNENKSASQRRRELNRAAATANQALTQLGGAAGQTVSAMYQGAKGAAAFNSALGNLSSAAASAAAALVALGGPLGMAAAGLLAAGAAALKFAQTANEMADSLYDTYSALSKTGAAASDGMSGVFEDAKSLGLSLKELGSYASTVASSGAELAMLSGTVFEGRKRFAELGKQLEPFREQFFSLGMTMPDVVESLGTFIRLQTRAGLTQNLTQEELGVSARKFIYEMDELRKLTGLERQEIEGRMADARREQRFRARLEQLRASGDQEAIKLAQQYEAISLILGQTSPVMARAFRDATTGIYSSDESIKGLVSTYGDLEVSLNQLNQGQIDQYEFLSRTGKALQQYTKDFNQLAQIGVDSYGVDFAQAVDTARLASMRSAEIDELIAQEQEKQGGKNRKATDETLRVAANLRNTQVNANRALMDFVSTGVVPAQKAMLVLAKATEAGTATLNELFGINIEGKTAEDRQAIDRNTQQLKDTHEQMGKLEHELSEAKKIGDSQRVSEIGQQIKQTRNLAESLQRGIAVAGSGLGGASIGGPEMGGMDIAPPSAESAVDIPIAKNATTVPPIKLSDIIKFTDRTGSEENFKKLDANVQKAFVAMAKEYFEITGDKLQINSAFRTFQDQARLASSGLANLVAEPGRSLHEQGRAIDIQSSQRLSLAEKGLLEKHGFRQLGAQDPMHIYMRDGGIVPATPGGVKVVAAEAGRNEAFVPLPDGKTIPVTVTNANNDANEMLSVRIDRLVSTISNNLDYYAGFGQTQIIDALKDMASSHSSPDTDKAARELTFIEKTVGAIADVYRSQTSRSNDLLDTAMESMFGDITNDMVKVSSRMVNGDIAVEIGQRVKEVIDTDRTDMTESIESLREDLKTAIDNMSSRLAAKDDTALQIEMIDLLKDIRQSQRNIAGSSERMALVATN